RQSVPISTYLMVIGAARFAVQHVESVDGIPIQTWVFPQDKAAGFALFGEARKPLEFFAERIGPYPYEKLANVQSTNRYGATEFASSIFYGERIFGRGNAFGLMVHEIAHQWFGDSITTNDWNHVWLSEGFATYLTHLYFEETVSRERLIEGMKRDRQQVIRNAQRNPDQPLVDYRLPVEQTLTGDAYRKGAWLLHMLRHKIGDETFWSGLRQYYRKYRDKNAVSEDFQKVMEEVSGQELGTFFRQWLYTPAHPKFTGDWHYEEATTQLIVRLNQVQPHHRFSVPLELGIWYDGAEEPRIEKVQINDKSQTFQFRVPAPPVSVVLDPQTWLLMEAQFAKREK
ncbi:MAG: M1 family aminopeptidase, partial [Gammaproteobacteria bacterium]|nr:M1 family aminopeptidase [Gammaproteobacteria bacterium]